MIAVRGIPHPIPFQIQFPRPQPRPQPARHQSPRPRLKARAGSPLRLAPNRPAYTCTNEVDRRIATLNAHLHQRKPINPVEVARTLEWLLGQPTVKKQADLAQRLAMKEKWISKMLTILRLPVAILAQVATLRLPRSSAQSLVFIARVSDPIHQQQLIDLLLAGASHRQILRKIAELSGKTVKQSLRKRVVEAGDGYQFAITRPGGVISILGILAATDNLLARIRAEATAISLNEDRTGKRPRLARFKANGKPVLIAQEIAGDGVVDGERPATGTAMLTKTAKKPTSRRRDGLAARILRMGAMAMVVLSGMANTVLAQIPCQYEVAQVFQGPVCVPYGPDPTTATGLSPNGQYVCGWYNPCGGHNSRSYYWSAATGMVTLPLPANISTMAALDVNDAGQVVGWCDGASVITRGFIFNLHTGQFTFVPNLASGQCEVSAINNAGVACGFRTFDAENVLTSAFIRTADGVLTDLGVVNGPRSAAVDIAEDGTVVGWTGIGAGYEGSVGFLYFRGNLTLLPPVAPNGSSRPWAISPNGTTVVGQGYIPGPVPFSGANRAFVFANGVMTLIEPVPGFRSSVAYGINDSGLVTVMCGQPVGGGETRLSFVWHNGMLHPLDDDINQDPKTLGLVGVSKINPAGLILASGAAAPSNSVGLILAPVPPPLGDVDQNCRTDIDDLVGVIVDWGKSKSLADLNSDAIVDVLDLIIVIENWTGGLIA